MSPEELAEQLAAIEELSEPWTQESLVAARDRGAALSELLQKVEEEDTLLGVFYDGDDLGREVKREGNKNEDASEDGTEAATETSA